ncbi:MAG TPA: hypothetical protein VES40_03915 [Ilumatobacteraceae bacterium]|nr:hypothetical protein [Ilumatobacteraceae bacterium]
MRNRYSISLILGAIIGASTLVAGPGLPAAAANYSLSVNSPVPVHIGVDAVGGSSSPGYDISPCALGGGPGAISFAVGGTPNLVRVEMYPGICGFYDGWSNVGGVHFEANLGGGSLGAVTMPVDGQGGAFALRGGILSSAPIGTGRVIVDTFQIPTGYPDPPAPLQWNGQVEYGAFASTASRGAVWSGGVGWAGRYLLFVTDTATGRKITANVDIGPNSIPTIDLDAICFGFSNCIYNAGGPGTTAGAFHPTTPTRILDTRRPLGFWGAVPSGDGRESSPDPITRRFTTANHDLQVTGLNGIPASGVSAVLLNVTAVSAGAPGPGFLSVVPKPPGVGDVFNDQGSYGAFPSTSNLNIDSGDPVPNLVLARVGAGGKIRIANFLGPTHVIADVAGWFGTGGAHTEGAGFAGVVPARLLDSRNGIGGPAQQFGAGEIRSLQVAGVAGVPREAQSVVVNITLTAASGIGFITAFPAGQPVPDASNVNIVPGGVRANTAVIKVGAGGRINLLMAEANADVIVDVLGSFGPYGGKVTTITPERIVDSRNGVGTPAAPWGDGEVRNVAVAGRGSVPAGATAVIANVTATNTTAWGFLSAWPAGLPQPASSNLNFLPGQNVPNLVMLKLGAGGQLSIFNGRGSANVIVDVMGYVN